MGTCIRINDTLNTDAIIAEGVEYYAEITREQASKIAAIVDAAGIAFVANDEHYDVFVESFGLSLLPADKIADIRAIAPEAEALIEQILRHDIKLYVTEALGLGAGRYMIGRECFPARDVTMNLAGGNFHSLWRFLDLEPETEDGTCGEADLDTVEQALNAYQHALGSMAAYGTKLRELVAYGRQLGATSLYWA